MRRAARSLHPRACGCSIGRIRRGQDATFTVDTYGDAGFAGRVATIYPQAEIRDNVVNYVAVIRFRQAAERTLRPEMTAAVRLPLDLRRGVLALPLRAVRQDGRETHVLVRRGEGFVQRAVRIGVRDDGYGEIVDGLAEGDEVAIGGREGA